ncbi:MAG TPA: response regulator [Candidatus Nitrosopolaris sp.]|nr:response regulator [Candidatus Nitrosopolaris sp.]
MKILIAEDDIDIALLYRVALRDKNHHVVITDNGVDCLAIYREELKNFISRMGCLDINKQHVFDLVILDYGIPRTNGIEVAKEIIRINPKQRIIMASAYPRETLSSPMKEIWHLVEFVQKPFNVETIMDTIGNKQSHSELRSLDRSPSMSQEFDLLNQEHHNDLRNYTEYCLVQERIE